MTSDLINAIRFYEGDVSDLPEDLFWQDEKAYVTWNALFFDGIETELARASENRYLNPAIISHPQRILQITCDLLSGMKKSTQPFHVRRVERFIDYHKFKEAGQFTSLISTSKNGFLNAYTDKKDLVLLEVDVKPGVHTLDFEKVLNTYQKADESEILIAPYCTITCQNLTLPESLMTIKDRNGNGVKVYARVIVEPSNIKREEAQQSMSESIIDASVRCYEAWNAKREAQQEDVENYLLYKKWFQQAVKQFLLEQRD